MIRPMKSGSQAHRISGRFQKRRLCAFAHPCHNAHAGRIGSRRSRRVPAAVTRSAQADASCLLMALAGHAPFSKSATSALLVSHCNRPAREGSPIRAVLQKRRACAFEKTACAKASQIPLAAGHSQKRRSCAFGSESR